MHEPIADNRRAAAWWRAAMVLLGGCLAAQPSVASEPAVPSADQDRTEIRRLADAWDAAIVAKDMPAVAANMAPEFQQIRSDGARRDRAQFLEAVADPGLTIQPYTVEDFEVRLYGDTALVFGRTRMVGTAEGEPFELYYRFTDVYVRGPERWQVVAIQITSIRE